MASLRTSSLIAVVSLLACGCFSRLTGNEGRFVFGYPATADILNFNQPIAPGARLDLHAFELGSGDEMTVIDARSSAPDVLKIVRTEGDRRVVLQGVTNGSARIEMVARDAQGHEFTDTVDMHVARPDRLVFRHGCTDHLFATYPANSSDVVIPFSMERENGQAVIGYGFHPIRVKPSTSLRLDEESRDQGALHFRSRKPRHRVSIRSRIDDAYLGLALVDPAEVDDVVPKGEGGVGATVVGAETVVSLQPTVSGVVFCQSPLMMSARSTTPDVCSATARLGDEDSPAENSLGIVRVEGLAYGVCEFEVVYRDANDGEGLRKTFRMPVGKFPSIDEGSASEDWPWWLPGLLGLLAPLTLFPILARRR